MKINSTAVPGNVNAEQAQAANYAGVVHALLICEEACNACADACLDEISRLDEFRRCIRLNLDGADVCGAMLRLLMRQTGAPNELVKAQLHASAIACQLVADECRTHAVGHAHCEVCAEVCQHCAERCHQLIDDIAWTAGSSAPFKASWQ